MAHEIAPRIERRVGRHITIANTFGEAGATAGERIKNGLADGSFQALLPSAAWKATAFLRKNS